MVVPVHDHKIVRVRSGDKGDRLIITTLDILALFLYLARLVRCPPFLTVIPVDLARRDNLPLYLDMRVVDPREVFLVEALAKLRKQCILRPVIGVRRIELAS
jgi:hypothetical protein